MLHKYKNRKRHKHWKKRKGITADKGQEAKLQGARPADGATKNWAQPQLIRMTGQIDCSDVSSNLLAALILQLILLSSAYLGSWPISFVGFLTDLPATQFSFEMCNSCSKWLSSCCKAAWWLVMAAAPAFAGAAPVAGAGGAARNASLSASFHPRFCRWNSIQGQSVEGQIFHCAPCFTSVSSGEPAACAVHNMLNNQGLLVRYCQPSRWYSLTLKQGEQRQAVYHYWQTKLYLMQAKSNTIANNCSCLCYQGR